MAKFPRKKTGSLASVKRLLHQTDIWLCLYTTNPAVVDGALL